MRGVPASRIFAYCEDGGNFLPSFFLPERTGFPNERWTNGFRTNERTDNERTGEWPGGIPDWMTQTIQRLGFQTDRMTDRRLTDSWLTINRFLNNRIPDRWTDPTDSLTDSWRIDNDCLTERPMDSACTNHTPQHSRDSYFFSKYGIDVYICKIHGFPNQPTIQPKERTPNQPNQPRGFRTHTHLSRNNQQPTTRRDSRTTRHNKGIPTSTTIRIPPIRIPNFRPVHSHPQQGQGTKDKDSTRSRKSRSPIYYILRNIWF